MNDCTAHRPAARYTIDGSARCLVHAAFSRRLLRTSIPLATVVGTVLTAINQGTVLLDGSFPDALWWKIPLTYSVPFFVSTWSQLKVLK